MAVAFDLFRAKLYTFVDAACLNGRDPVEITRQLCAGGSDLIQLRAKGFAEDEVLALANQIVPIADAAGVPLVINDFPRVALRAGAQFCHLGQEDFFDCGYKTTKDVWRGDRAVAPQLGLSTHTPNQAERALAARPAYIAIGPVFATPTKPGAIAVTLDYVRWASTNVDIPWFAIGGINLSNVDHVLEAGATRVCVVSAILNAPDIALACKQFRAKLEIKNPPTMFVRFYARLFVAALFWMAGPGLSCSADDATSLVINTRRLHLRSGDRPEWEEFADQTPDAQRLDLHFNAQPNAGLATLFIRQDGVKEDWFVELNGKRLGKLFLMEADLIHSLAVPPDSLRSGDNLLSVVPPKEVDDIILREMKLDFRPIPEAIHQSVLEVKVNDIATSKSIPCRLTIVDAQGTLVPLVALTNAPLLAIRPGVIYTGNGEAGVGLPGGDYTVFASRGFEWSVATQMVHVASNQTAQLDLHLRHEVQTAGLISCDTHVHTFTLSGHGDATLDERMLTLAGEGIELPIATDHNVLADYSEPARRLGLQKWFTPVIGDEVTTSAGHFNIFPVVRGSRLPDWHVTHWPDLMKSIRSTPGVQVVVLNHPLNIHSGFQPFAATNFNMVTGENKRGADFTFDAIEVLNSSAQQSDYMQPYRGWFALLNYGYRFAAVGSSDCHDVSRYIVGQSRTYISCPDADPGHIDVALACSNLLAGRATVSMGLLTDLSVNGKFGVGDLATGPLEGQLKVTLDVRGPSWVTATNFALFANGVKVSDKNIVDLSLDEISSAHKANITWGLPHPIHDLYLVAIAIGPGVTAPFWAIPRPYQPASPHWEARVIGSTNPIWVDGDHDGKFTAPRGYARQLVEAFGTNTARLLAVLGEFDETVASQAASLTASLGYTVNSDVLKSAAPHVQRGFAAFASTLK